MTNAIWGSLSGSGRPGDLLRSENLYLFLFIALGAYCLLGVFPLAFLFGDGLGIANGVTLMADGGVGIDNPLSYRFSQHPGSHVLLAALHELTGIDAHPLLLAMCALFASLFIIVSALLIRDLVGCPLGVAGIVVLLFQESFSAGYYANSNVLAGVFCLTSIFLLNKAGPRPMFLFSGILFGLGVFMRLDAILLAPVVIAMVHRGSWQQTAVRTAAVGAIAAVTWAAAFFGSGATIDAVLQAMHEKKDLYPFAVGTRYTFRSHLAFFPLLSLLLIVIGLSSLIRNRNWRVLAILGLGVVPFYLIFPHGLGTSRHLYYFTPFFALPATVALWSWRPGSRQKRHLFAATIVVLFVVQYAFGAYWGTTEDGSKRLRLRLSAGEERVNVINNGGRLMTGLAYSPVWHRQEKQMARHRERELGSYLDGDNYQTATLYAVGWTSGQRVLMVLLRRGYTLREIEKDAAENWTRYLFDKNGHSVRYVHFDSLRSLNRTLESDGNQPLRNFDGPGTATWQTRCVIGQFIGQAASESICLMKNE